MTDEASAVAAVGAAVGPGVQSPPENTGIVRVSRPRRITVRQHDAVVKKLIADHQALYVKSLEDHATITELRAQLVAAEGLVNSLRAELAKKDTPVQG